MKYRKITMAMFIAFVTLVIIIGTCGNVISSKELSNDIINTTQNRINFKKVIVKGSVEKYYIVDYLEFDYMSFQKGISTNLNPTNRFHKGRINGETTIIGIREGSKTLEKIKIDSGEWTAPKFIVNSDGDGNIIGIFLDFSIKEI